MTTKPKITANLTGFIYLVTLSHGMDDIPIRLFTDDLDAFSFADRLDWTAPSDLLRLLELPECNTPCVVTVTTFRDGEPVGRVIVKEFDVEAEAEE